MFPAKAFSQPADPNLILQVTMRKMDNGLYHIHFEPVGGAAINAACMVVFKLSLDFYSGTPDETETLLGTHTLADAPSSLPANGRLHFVSENDGDGGFYFWWPMGFQYDHVVTLPTVACGGFDASQVSFVRIITDISTIGTCSATEFIQYNIAYPDGQSNTGTTTGMTSHTYTLMEPGGYPQNIPLSLLSGGDIESLVTCQFGSLRYVVPYGGCPPYTQSWNTPNFSMTGANIWGWFAGNVIESIIPSFVYPFAVKDIVAVVGTNSYTVTVTDAAGSSLSTNTQPTQALKFSGNIYGQNDCINTVNLSGVLSSGIKHNWLGGRDLFSSPPEGVTSFHLQSDPATNLLSGSQLSIPRSGNYVATVSIHDQGASCLLTQTVYIDRTRPADITTKTLSTDEVWNTNHVVEGIVTVPTGKTLTIENNAELLFKGEGSGINVEKGARLIIQNAQLQGDCDHHAWRGIWVQGNWEKDHPLVDTYLQSGNPATLHPDHGLVIVRQQAKISDAKIAINSAKNLEASFNPKAGGIVYADEATFENNRIAIRIDEHKGNLLVPAGTKPTPQRSVIQNCLFQHTALFPSSSGLPVGLPNNYISVRLNKAGEGLKLKDNDFEANASVLTGAQRGTGIWAADTRIDVKSTAFQAHHFDGLYKGVECFNSLTTLKNSLVQGYQFNNVQKGITFNGSLGARVRYNHFDVPPGTNTDESYGIYAIKAYGVRIENNELNSNLTANWENTYSKGVVIDRSYSSGYDSHLTNNLFTGGFGAATQFLGDNQRLHTNCNAYSQDLIDWHLNSSAILPEQGVCGTNADIALRTHFHMPYATFENWHIKNDNTSFELVLNIDNSPQSLPTLIEGDVAEPTICEQDGIPTINNSCFVLFPDEIIGGGGGCDDEKTVRYQIQTYLENDETDSLLALLHCVDTEWAIKILVGSYVDKYDYNEALAQLERLDDSGDNLSFKALYYALINDYLSEDGGSGKAAVAETQVRQTANDATSDNQTLAESILAMYRGEDYVRNGEAIAAAKSAANPTKPTFTLAPNPAQGSLALKIAANTISLPQTISIYDLHGRVVLQSILQTDQTVIDITSLPTGLYWVHLQGETQKLVVIK